MRLLAITLMFIHYLLAPLANASIQEHLDKHHTDNKSHHHSSNHHGHNDHHHDHEESADDQSEDHHEHSFINIDKYFSLSTFKEVKGLYLVAINQANPLGIKDSIARLNILNYHYINRPLPPPNAYRNLPLLN